MSRKSTLRAPTVSSFQVSPVWLAHLAASCHGGRGRRHWSKQSKLGTKTTVKVRFANSYPWLIGAGGDGHNDMANHDGKKWYHKTWVSINNLTLTSRLNKHWHLSNSNLVRLFQTWGDCLKQAKDRYQCFISFLGWQRQWQPWNALILSKVRLLFSATEVNYFPIKSSSVPWEASDESTLASWLYDHIQGDFC